MHHGLQRPKVPGRVVLLNRDRKKIYSWTREMMQIDNLIQAGWHFRSFFFWNNGCCCETPDKTQDWIYCAKLYRGALPLWLHPLRLWASWTPPNVPPTSHNNVWSLNTFHARFLWFPIWKTSCFYKPLWVPFHLTWCWTNPHSGI